MARFRNTPSASDPQKALRFDNLDHYYLPRFDLCSNKIVGMEVMVRWPPSGPLTLPSGRLLDTISDKRELLDMGEEIMRRACTRNVHWAESGHHHLILALSLSPHQLASPDFPAMVAAILEESGLPPDRLELEITERMLIDNLENSATTLSQLEKMGIHITITDFGTSYQSLYTLQRPLIDTVKIAAPFVAGIGFNPDDEAMISAIIAMASSLDLTTVATGVETKEQARFLRREGCNHIQGRFHGQPLSTEEFTKTLELYRLLDKTRSAASRIAGTIRGFHA